jgi:hypothetical protein
MCDVILNCMQKRFQVLNGDRYEDDCLLVFCAGFSGTD